MKKYGKIKISTQVEGHQNCTICHPEDEADVKARARRENKKEIEDQILGLEEQDNKNE